MKHLWLWLIVMLSSVCVIKAQAQEKEYMYEIGATAGTSWGYGDVNASSVIYKPSLSAGILFRYNLNLRWALAADLQYQGLRGDSRDFDVAFPGGDYDYKLSFWSLDVRPEFSFWNYGYGSDYREKRRYAPYLTLGITAGVLTGGDSTDSKFAFGIPVGGGFKFKVGHRWNAHVAALFTKTFSDDLDGCADPEGIKTSALIGNDWVASIHIGLTFDFKERCEECHKQ